MSLYLCIRNGGCVNLVRRKPVFAREPLQSQSSTPRPTDFAPDVRKESFIDCASLSSFGDRPTPDRPYRLHECRVDVRRRDAIIQTMFFLAFWAAYVGRLSRN
jgi:hypothetical protein